MRALAFAGTMIVLCLLAAPASAQQTSLEDSYIAARDAALARFTPDKVPKIDDKATAEEERARGELETQMRGIVTAAPPGFGKGEFNLSTLFTGDEELGVLDGLLFEADGGATRMIVTTRGLLQRWLRGHRAWWPNEPMPGEPVAAFRTERFYTQAVRTDSAIARLARIPLRRGGAAMLAARTQDEMPDAADEVFVAAVKGKWAYVAWRKLKPPIEAPACSAARKAASAAASNKGDDAASHRADEAYKRCFANRAPKDARFAGAVSAAKALYNAMK